MINLKTCGRKTHLLGGPEENNKVPQSSWSLGSDSKTDLLYRKQVRHPLNRDIKKLCRICIIRFTYHHVRFPARGCA